MRSRHHRRQPRPPVFRPPYDAGYPRRHRPPPADDAPYEPHGYAPIDYDGARPRRYPRAYDAGHPHRRREDREGPGERRRTRPWRERWERLRERERERGWLERGREFVRRHREPIIGLTLAGAAAPIAKGAREAPREPPRTAERLASVSPRRPVEEEVGRRWAESRAERIREATIEGAMVAYGIPRKLAEDIHDAAVANGLEPELGFGLVKTESGFDHRAVSNVGARGLTQVMPRTARWLRPGTTAEDLFDRTLNLNMGFGYLRSLIDKYDGDVRLALLAYNRGPGTVDRILRRGGDPDNGYADKVLEGYEDLG